MNAHNSWLNANANNIANVNTDRFIPTQTNLSENNGSVEATFKKADDMKLHTSQTDLNKEIPEQILASYGFRANAVSFRTYDEMMGSVIDLKA
jgi:flagellar hook protein FlgE